MLLDIRILTANQFKKLVPILLIGCIFSSFTSFSQCISITRSARDIKVKNKQGVVQILNPENISEADDKFASAQTLVVLNIGSGIPSDGLEIKDFGFNVPELATICGIEVKVKRKSSSAVNVTVGQAGPKDKQVMLLKNGNTVGLNTAKSNYWNASNAYSEYGANNGLWGTTLTPADVNNSNFGISMAMTFSASLINVGLLMKAEIDHVEMTVHYQPVVVLPIRINDFKAAVTNNKVQLNWALSNDEAGTSVLLQRSSNATTWTTIEQQRVNDNSLAVQQYSYTDLPLEAGTYFYRLKTVSPNGSVHYSKEVPVRWKGINQSSQYIQNGKQLIIRGTTAKGQVRLLNSNGSILKSSFHTTAQNTMIDISLLPTGIYFLHIGEQVHKFVKQ